MTRSAAHAWSMLTWLLVVAVFTQSIFAGVLLSGEGWGRTAHGITALALVAVTVAAGIAAALTVRGVSRDASRLTVLLFALAVILFARPSSVGCPPKGRTSCGCTCPWAWHSSG
jgi:hypothetical protein